MKNSVLSKLDEKGIIYKEFANGQIQVDGVNYWTTSEKFYDPSNNQKGKGANAFLTYIYDKLKINGSEIKQRQSVKRIEASVSIDEIVASAHNYDEYRKNCIANILTQYIMENFDTIPLDIKTSKLNGQVIETFGINIVSNEFLK